MRFEMPDQEFQCRAHVRVAINCVRYTVPPGVTSQLSWVDGTKSQCYWMFMGTIWQPRLAIPIVICLFAGMLVVAVIGWCVTTLRSRWRRFRPPS